MGSLSIIHWVILILLVALPVGLFLWLRRSKSSAPAYRSLKLTSPILTFLIVVAMIARPILDYYRSHVPQANEISPVILAPLGLFVLVCICAAVAATVYFFYRAMQNINVFAGRQVHAPMTTLLMVIPVANLVATPYIHYATYYGSMALSPAHHASRLGAAALAVGAFVLFLANLVFGAASNSSALFEEPYDAVSLSLVATFAGLAGGILYTRIVSRIFKAQEAHAERIGIIASTGKARDRFWMACWTGCDPSRSPCSSAPPRSPSWRRQRHPPGPRRSCKPSTTGSKDPICPLRRRRPEQGSTR